MAGDNIKLPEAIKILDNFYQIVLILYLPNTLSDVMRGAFSMMDCAVNIRSN